MLHLAKNQVKARKQTGASDKRRANIKSANTHHCVARRSDKDAFSKHADIDGGEQTRFLSSACVAQ
jgi:hypothetical protein